MNGGAMSDEFLKVVTQGEVEKVKEMLKTDPGLAQATDARGVSAILKAAYFGQKAVVEILLATGLELSIFEAAATVQNAHAWNFFDTSINRAAGRTE